MWRLRRNMEAPACRMSRFSAFVSSCQRAPHVIRERLQAQRVAQTSDRAAKRATSVPHVIHRGRLATERWADWHLRLAAAWGCRDLIVAACALSRVRLAGRPACSVMGGVPWWRSAADRVDTWQWICGHLRQSGGACVAPLTPSHRCASAARRLNPHHELPPSMSVRPHGGKRSR